MTAFATLAQQKIEAAGMLLDATNEKELAGDKLTFAIGTAVTLAITGLAFAVLAGLPEKAR